MEPLKYIENKIQTLLEVHKEAIIVLKGIENTNDEKVIAFDTITNNKLAYLFQLSGTQKRVISYEEYLILYDMILMQYKEVIILNNNCYLNFFPLQLQIEDKKIESLMTHYDEEKQGDVYSVEDIQEYVNVYSNVIQVKDTYYVAYNTIIRHEKEKYIDLVEAKEHVFSTQYYNEKEKVYEIESEEDYVLTVQNMIKGKEKTISILEKNSGVSKKVLLNKLQVVKTLFPNMMIFLVKEEQQLDVRQDTAAYKELLRHHWGHENFRPVQVYNLKALQNKKKVVEEISQVNIIDDVIKEVEKCKVGKGYRDVFVTAPTGAGKSAMFQIPAIYLANKYELFTIVISPLIGLMKDQVNNLGLHKYDYARTINSDISPLQKQEIINDIADKKCHILYLSPESLLSKSDLQQIIGDRILGLLVVDEAHIVTTWGKQFRPDYWYLGDHINKIKKSQQKTKGMGFVIATFTATAIYGGVEDMYEETIESLKMVDPITYLGFVRRNDICINVDKTKLITNKTEYEVNKFDQLIEKMNQALIFYRKMLIYFPTVSLINRFKAYCIAKNYGEYIAIYHGQLNAGDKEANYHSFLNNEKLVMAATKAFGMGIDIDDIQIVAHFAPTGNVCDYVQEIGRAARRPSLQGEAYYKFMSNDFKHINRLHGVSVVKDYQLVQVIQKVYELYQEHIKKNAHTKMTKKRNEMLVDAESFAHIFENPFFSEDDGINKVKTAMLLIQKDFEKRFSFSPFYVRPIPLFETGYFKLQKSIQEKVKTRYGPIVKEEESQKHICAVNLKAIWEKDFSRKYSFPKFKYLLYTNGDELNFEYKYEFVSALRIDIGLQGNYLQEYERVMQVLKAMINKSIREECYYKVSELLEVFENQTKMNKYKVKNIIENLLAAMAIYQRDFSTNMYSKTYVTKPLKNGDFNYKFTQGALQFLRWVERGFDFIQDNTRDDVLYLLNDASDKVIKEKMIILGLLEVLEILNFKALGGKNSQLYIYVNQTKTLYEIMNKPHFYKNRLLELVGERHQISVEMLTYLFEGQADNETMWNHIEEYFLGIIPEEVIKQYEVKTGKQIQVQCQE